MNNALEILMLGVVTGFGLSVLISMIGTVIGKTLALFEVGT